MPVNEARLEEAFNLVDEAEALAKEGKFPKSMYKFQCALDLFDKSGLGIQKRQAVIDMVSTRQSEVQRIKDYLDEHPDEKESVLSQISGEKQGQQTADNWKQAIPQSPQTASMSNTTQSSHIQGSGEDIQGKIQKDVSQIEQQGLNALDTANELVKQGRYNESIGHYYNAVQFLIQAGWDEGMLKNIQETIMEVSKKIQSQSDH